MYFMFIFLSLVKTNVSGYIFKKTYSIMRRPVCSHSRLITVCALRIYNARFMKPLFDGKMIRLLEIAA